MPLEPNELPEVNEERFAWLPGDQNISAPQVLTNSEGKDIFLSGSTGYPF